MSRMILPADWDSPDKDNGSLCRKFKSGIWYCEDRSASFRYRYYKPYSKSGSGSEFPLAIYIHGADAFGDDNSSHLEMHDIGTMFAKDIWQEKHPCYILAPQTSMMQHWSRNDTVILLQEFVTHFLSRHDDIDHDRIYIYGYSAGGLGILKLLKKYPDFYAGAIPICGATDGHDILELLKTNVWLVHAMDDRIVRASYGKQGEDSKFFMGSADIYEVLKKHNEPGHEILFTGYPEDWMKNVFGVNPHCSWVTVSDERHGAEFRSWLFRQRRTSH